MDWRGKTALVTGGVNGIGFGIARAFAEAGMAFILADCREANRAALGGKAVHLSDLA